MRDNFNNYKTELDRLRLTEESKKALAASLARQGGVQEAPRRRTGTLRLAAVIAAAICLLATAGYAAAAAAPTLWGSVFTDSAAYEKSSAFIGRTVDNNGWTVTITDCVGDDLNLYLGLELAAPEGTVLEEGSYCFGKGTFQYTLNFPGMKAGGSEGLYQLPDENPADNRLTFVLTVYTIFEEDAGFNGQKMHLKLPELQTRVWDAEKQKYNYTIICPGKWDFGMLTISYPDSAIRLEPNLPVTTLDVEAVITEVTVSPLGVRVRIEGDALKGHHSWVPKNAPDGWYGCIEYQEIVLHFEDGTSFTVGQADSNLSGSGCSGGTNTDEDGYLFLRRTYSRDDPVNGVAGKLIDVDKVTSVSVCGVEIPLR